MDIITYISDLMAFRAEALQKANEGVAGFVMNDGGVNYTIGKIPVHYSGSESLCLVRLNTQDEINIFTSMASCVRIGVCENNSYVFDSPEKEAIYDRVYPRAPTIAIDDDGIEYTKVYPYKIGVFS